MGRGWVLLGVAALSGCGKAGDLSIGATGFGGDPGSGNTGGDGGAGAGGSADAGGAGGSADAGQDCVVTCCDGSIVEGAAGAPESCEIAAGIVCAGRDGPVSITHAGDTVWTAGGACPTMRPCTANCCSGKKQAQADHFDGALCAELAQASHSCADEGGAAKIFFGDLAVYEDLACAGSCQTSCCDGSVAFSAPADQHQCELWAGRMCRTDEGGPSMVAFAGTMVWTAGGQCPSLKSCDLVCDDASHQVTEQYQAMVCVVESLASPYCAEHGGPVKVAFDGQEAWKAL